MDKSNSQIGVNPLTKINPLTMVASIGDPAQSEDARASLLAKQASLMAKQAKSSLDQAAKTTTSIADVSDTAKLINQLVKQAEANGATHRYIAQSAITTHPKLPNVVSQQLKTAISQSGLFYESHLSEFVDGQRQLASIKQEPQNQFNQSAYSLLPQQLHILEHQRLSWHGEVWPNQLMNWDIYLKNAQDERKRQAQKSTDSDIPIASNFTLHLPNIGKVTAKIILQNGHMYVDLSAEEKETSQLLKDNSSALASAIESHGQVLEGLTVESCQEIP